MKRSRGRGRGSNDTIMFNGVLSCLVMPCQPLHFFSLRTYVLLPPSSFCCLSQNDEQISLPSHTCPASYPLTVHSHCPCILSPHCSLTLPLSASVIKNSLTKWFEIRHPSIVSLYSISQERGTHAATDTCTTDVTSTAPISALTVFTINTCIFFVCLCSSILVLDLDLDLDVFNLIFRVL
jgi:hypothetical protein